MFGQGRTVFFFWAVQDPQAPKFEWSTEYMSLKTSKKLSVYVCVGAEFEKHHKNMLSAARDAFCANFDLRISESLFLSRDVSHNGFLFSVRHAHLRPYVYNIMSLNRVCV